ncbi:hypothetical protein IEE91_02230 [Kocuria sp. cx-455]|uniref:hypothetical protein n=1 Tax=Kocuria sp. cx-455 TaxID=2771377 RepID=UPI00168A00E3|nr:hypothetical protein [Kocuria sp. cx-455]MBD2764025.1 hypothetical protein [Kocuria sp. cx-455]
MNLIVPRPRERSGSVFIDDAALPALHGRAGSWSPGRVSTTGRERLLFPRPWF